MISINYTHNPRLTRKILGIAGAMLTLAIPYFIMLLNGHHHLDAEQSLCPFMLLTGLPCPGCGFTKSIISLYEGNIQLSLHYHLFGPLIFLLCIATILLLILEIFTNREYFRKYLHSKKIAYFLGFSLAVYHLTRLIFFISTHSLTEILHQSIWC